MTLNTPNWKPTITALHQAAMLIGPIHNALFAPRNNYLHLPMFVEPDGLTSQLLPSGGRIRVDFKNAQLLYLRGNGTTVTFAQGDHSQATLFEALLTALKEDELATFFSDVDSDTLATGIMAKLHADETRKEFLTMEEVTHTDPLTVDQTVAAEYADMQYAVFEGVARFRARLTGHMTSVVVWPEHFDLSTLWFHPDNAAMDDFKAHMNFGFAPYSPGFEHPYLYVYIYPYPEDFEEPAIPAPAVWNTDGFQGIVVRHDDLARQDDLAAFTEDLYLNLFDMLQPLLNMEQDA